MANAFDGNELMKNIQAQWNTAREMAHKRFGELTKVNQDMVDATLKSSSIMAKGAEDLSKRAIAFSHSSFEASALAAKGFIACRNLNDALGLQANFAKNNYDNLIAEANAVQKLSLKMANDAFAPLQEELHQTAEKLSKINR